MTEGRIYVNALMSLSDWNKQRREDHRKSRAIFNAAVKCSSRSHILETVGSGILMGNPPSIYVECE